MVPRANGFSFAACVWLSIIVEGKCWVSGPLWSAVQTDAHGKNEVADVCVCVCQAPHWH